MGTEPNPPYGPEDRDLPGPDQRNDERPAALKSEEALLNPFPWYAEMREKEVLPYDEERETYMAFRYDTVNEIFERDGNDQGISAARIRAPPDSPLSPMNQWMPISDPPRHTRLRKSVSKFFRPAYLEDYQPRLEELVDDLFDDVIDENGEEFDFIGDFAEKIPTMVICDLLGFPRNEWSQYREWTNVLFEPADGSLGEQEKAQAIGAWMKQTAGHVEKRKQNPDDYDDIMSHLVTYEPENGDNLTDEEIVGTCQLLMLAGNATTISWLGNTMRTFEEEDLHDAAINGSLNLESALEEVLRYRSSLQAAARRVTEDIEIQGKELPAGSWIEFWIGSANRDPRKFDDPETFKPDRSPNEHLAFGHGIHRCLGEPLARLEAETAFSGFYDRIDSIDADISNIKPQASADEMGILNLPVSVETS